MEYLLSMGIGLNVEQAFDVNSRLHNHVTVVVIESVNQRNESSEEVPSFQAQLGNVPYDNCLKVFGHSHVIGASSVVLAELFKRELSHVFRGLLAGYNSALRNLHIHKSAFSLVCQLIPHLCYFRLSVSITSGIIVRIHSHRIQKPVIYGAQIYNLAFLVDHVDEWHEQESLETV